ncbi:hypothetical protein JD844_019383 [Phrynosoma platyrhinos]|uniref:Uncharacterized protein n=1 Tax=Phrynosoma platyrhinos TaxID=52577 RepID=A0ABQ7SPR4_PHRPL|nr:hypothetical protein JD844_019383 [Phrynosoma platyrhinos]
MVAGVVVTGQDPLVKMRNFGMILNIPLVAHIEWVKSNWLKVAYFNQQVQAIPKFSMPAKAFLHADVSTDDLILKFTLKLHR